MASAVLMTRGDLAEWVATISVKGWRFWIETDQNGHEFLHVGAVDQPANNRTGGRLWPPFGDYFLVRPEWSPEDIWTRLFCTLQYLQDHELREQFTVDGVRVFEAHTDPPVTGFQKEWFVEHQSALRGY